MSQPTTPTKTVAKTFSTYKDVLDMSTSGGKSGTIVTVIVGTQKRSFQVHLARLGPLEKLFGEDGARKNEAELPDEDPEVFNLLVNWVYNEPLPRVGRESYQSEKTVSAKPMVKGSPGCSPCQTPQVTSPVPSKRKYEDSEPATPAKRLFNLGVAPGQNKTQRLLLKLMLLAEKNSWEELYNAAIDAFRTGEEALERRHPSLAHIEDVYLKTSPGSAIRKFFADYAYDMAKSNKNFTWYLQQGWFNRFPSFHEDMLKRMDGNGPFKYPFWCDGNVVIPKESPMELGATSYHIHQGEMKLVCEHSKLPVPFQLD